MSFSDFTPQQTKTNAPSTPIKAALQRMRGSDAKLIFTLTKEMVADLEWEAGTRLAVLIGDGDSHGLFRFRADPTRGVVTCDQRQLQRRDGRPPAVYFQIKLGSVARLVNRREPAKACTFKKLENGWVEVSLPRWAEVTSPTAVVKQQRQAVADQETRRVQKEAKSATVRRQEREADELELECRRQRDEQAKAIAKPRIHERFKLTGAERVALDAIARANGNVVTTEQIHHALYGDNPDGGPSTKIVDVLVCKIRKKIVAGPCQVETVWGEGYKLIGSAEALYSKPAELLA